MSLDRIIVMPLVMPYMTSKVYVFTLIYKSFKTTFTTAGGFKNY